jgi:hypothetical protein
MKKAILGFISIIIISCISFSCKQTKSLQELLQEERKAIDRFITSNDLIILKEYPKDGVFKEKEYFRTSDGMFFHVVDSGNGIRVQPLNDVAIRFDYAQYIKNVVQGDSMNILPSDYGSYYLYNPFSFIYGISQTYSSSYSPVCQAWVIPLYFVGEGAVLDLIVTSSLGSAGDFNSISPVFYKNLRYTSFN